MLASGRGTASIARETLGALVVVLGVGTVVDAGASVVLDGADVAVVLGGGAEAATAGAGPVSPASSADDDEQARVSEVSASRAAARYVIDGSFIAEGG